MKKIILFVFLNIISLNAIAQENRLSNYNNIGWYNYFGNFKTSEKISFHTDYQLRRTDYISDKQQGLLRLGINYQINSKVQLRLGYAWIETYPYGEIPLNGFGKDFTEHRAFQMATLTEKISSVTISHRFMFEQRWVGRYTNATLTTEDDFPLLNRFRYMFRAQIPLKGNEIKDKTPYLAMYDEIFIGFGKNVNENIFDQNRLGILLGYQFNKTLKIEGGFLSQIVQLGREVNNQNVFQYNNGFLINSIFNFDLSKSKQTKL